MIERARLSTCVLVCTIVGLAIGTGAVSATGGLDQETTSTAVALDQGSVLYSHTDSEDVTSDRHLESGGLYWQGQTVGFNDTAGVINTDRLYLREYTTGDTELGPLVREIDLGDEGTKLETDGLDGTYVLTLSEQRDAVVEFDNGNVARTVDIERATAFEVAPQTLDVEWELGRSDTVETDRELEIESNRVRYNINVTSPTLTAEELTQVFMGSRQLRDNNRPFPDRNPFEQRTQIYDVYAEDDVIVLRGFGDGALETDFSGIGTFPETIAIEVTDTGLSRDAGSPSNAVESGPLTISQLDVADNVDTGDQITLSATVTNEWSTTQNGTVTFELGETRSSVETTLDSGEETTLSTTLTAPAESGEVDYVAVTDGDRVEGVITVEGGGSTWGSDNSGDGDGSDDSGGGILATMIGLLYPQALIGVIMTVVSVATFIVWRRR